MGMEDDARHFFITIVQTVSMMVLWMLVNVILGIRLRLGLFEDKPSVINYIYYAAFLISLFFLIKYFIMKWKRVKKF